MRCAPGTGRHDRLYDEGRGLRRGDVWAAFWDQAPGWIGIDPAEPDLILPVLDLGQQKAFTPVGFTQWIAWAGALTGWLLATAVIAGITRRLVRS